MPSREIEAPNRHLICPVFLPLNICHIPGRRVQILHFPLHPLLFFRLHKGQGRQLLQALNAPAALYEKIPTADLEEEKPLLADEQALGVSYQAIDDYLEGKIVAVQDQARIEELWFKAEHKRHLPITIFDDFWK